MNSSGCYINGHGSFCKYVRQVASDATAKFACNPDIFWLVISGFISDVCTFSLLYGQKICYLTSNKWSLAVVRLDAAQQSLFFSQISLHPYTTGSARWILKNIWLRSLPLPLTTCVSANNAAALTIPVCRNARPLNGKTALREVNKYYKLTFKFFWRRTSSDKQCW